MDNERAPLSSRITTVAVLGFGAWTLLCNAVVLAGGSFRTLELSAMLVVVAATATWLLLRRRRRDAATSKDPDGLRDSIDSTQPMEADSPIEAAPDLQPWDPVHRPYLIRAGIVALSASAVVVLHRETGSLELLVVTAALHLLLSLVTVRRWPIDPLPGRPRQDDEPWLWGMAAVALAVTAVAHRPDADDAFYVNLAVSTLADRSLPLLTYDGIFGIEGMPILLPFYKVHSLELLAATVSHVLRLAPITVMHLVLPSVAALLAPLAWAELARRLLPHRWLLLTGLVLAILAVWGGTNAGYGNFAFVRLHQGKGVLLTVVLPLLVAYAIDYAKRPGRLAWLKLLAAQIAAIGLTSTALLVAPAVAVITLLAAWSYRRERVPALLIGLLTTGHALLMVLGLGGEMSHVVDALEGLRARVAAVPPATKMVRDAMKQVLGDGFVPSAAIFALLFAWCVPREGRTTARILVLVPLVFVALLMNPLTAAWISSHVLRPLIYFRVFWIVPLPLLVGIVSCFPSYAWPASRLRPWMAVPCLALALIGSGLLGERHTLHSSNGTRITWPGIKAPPLEFEAARMLVESTPQGAYVVAPKDVATWVSTLESLTHPIYSRHIYQRFLGLALSPEQVRRRRSMMGYVSVSGIRLAGVNVLCTNAEHFGLTGICLRRLPEQGSQPETDMRECGFWKVGENAEYEVWARDP